MHFTFRESLEGNHDEITERSRETKSKKKNNFQMRIDLEKGKQTIGKKGGNVLCIQSFPIDANCFKSQRNNWQTKLALGGKTLLVIKLGKCLFFLKC